MAAAAVVQTASGDVKAAIGSAAPVMVTQNSALENGMTVTTGDNSHVVMKFEDGQVVALNANTSFKIEQYHFEQAKPQKSSMIFSLLKGAMRAVTGLIAKNNANAFTLHTPSATIGIRGTDFMAATGSLYLQVINGTVSATTSAGTTAFAVGQTGFVASLSALPTAIAAAQLPAAVAASFSQLGSIAMAGTGAAAGGATSGGAAGGTAATGAAVGGLSTVAVVGTVAAVAAVAAIAANDNPTAAAATTTVTAP
ncbi:MAG: FecR family protein [Sideroxyarcus sp.]|nr:FecR family protein [Sideroxyarcus sp.]